MLIKDTCTNSISNTFKEKKKKVVEHTFSKLSQIICILVEVSKTKEIVWDFVCFLL